MHPFLQDLIPFRTVHAYFADWERAKHRAYFFSAIGFPDSHPLRQILENVSMDLEEHRWAADAAMAEVRRKHGDFRTYVNGYFFENSSDWFKSGKQIYWDCPAISFGKGVRRDNSLYLAGVASIHDLEASGRRFIEAVDCLVEKARPQSKIALVKSSRTFDKDCRRLERHLKRVKVCARDRINVLLCLQRKGVPAVLAPRVLSYLV